MNIEACVDIDRCVMTAELIKNAMRQGSAEMEECTRGEVLAVYRDATEKAIVLVDQITDQLHNIRDSLLADS